MSPAAQALVSALPGLTSSFPALTAALSAPQIQLPPPGDLSNSATALAFVANMLANPTLAPLVSSLLAAQMQQQQQQQTQLQQPALHPSAGGYPTAYAQPLSAQYSVVRISLSLLIYGLTPSRTQHTLRTLFLEEVLDEALEAADEAESASAHSSTPPLAARKEITAT